MIRSWMIPKFRLSELIKCENTEFAISKLKPYDCDIETCERFWNGYIEKGGYRNIFFTMSKNIAYMKMSMVG